MTFVIFHDFCNFFHGKKDVIFRHFSMEKIRKIQENPGKSRKIQENPEKSRKIQKNP
jgi:hypothetical protein